MGPTPVCGYQDLCSGCQLLKLSADQQRSQKTENLKALLSQKNLNFSGSIQWKSLEGFYLRDRLDFTWTSGRLGLFSQDKSEVVDLEKCLQLSPALQAWLTDFRKFQWPFQKASFRLRVGPQGQRGVWIDAANLDIKALLEEKNLLMELMKLAFVEIGQKRKTPKRVGDQFKLQDPELRIWFQSWFQEKPVDLFCHIASFTQPGLRVNRLIADQLREWMLGLGPQRILEFGSGIGNLSFPVLEFAKTFTAYELDSLSIEGFQKSLQHHGLESKVEFLVGDFQKNKNIDFTKYDLALCNPPRSGLKDFVLPILEDPRKAPAFLIYMSCFPESLVTDLERLQTAGYQIKEMSIVDQFPQTRHYEVLTLLQRK